MKAIPERLGKGVANAQEVEESIAKAIPEWMDNNNVPNIADKVKKHVVKVTAGQKANKDDNVEDILDFADSVSSGGDTSPSESSTGEAKVDEEDLFEEEEPPAKSEVEAEVPEVEVAAETEPLEVPLEEQKVDVLDDDFDDFFADDDLFKD
jgi:hypothetical protein